MSRTAWPFLILALVLFAVLMAIPLRVYRAPAKPPTPAVRAQAIEHSFEITIPINVTVFRLINDGHAPLIDAIFSRIIPLGMAWVLLPVLLLLWAYRREKIVVLLLAVLIETIIVDLLKGTTRQGRPGAVLDQVHLLDPLYFRSFPSGDAAMAAAIAVAVALGERWPAWCGMALYALVIAYERVYVGAHFPLDALTGMLVGALSAWLACLAVTAWRRRARRGAAAAHAA